MSRDAATWEPTVSVRLVQPVLLAMRRENVAVDDVLERVGLSREVAADLSRRIPLAIADRLWEQAASTSASPSFGLDAATLVTPGLYDVPEYAARKQRSMGEGFRVFARFTGLLHDSARIRFIDAPDQVTLFYEMIDGVPAPAVWTEHVLGAFVLIGRSVTGSSWSPLAIRFQHAGHARAPQRFAELLGVTPQFEAPSSVVVIPRSAWDRPTLEADSGLAEVLERYAEALLQRSEHGSTLVGQVQRVISAELCGGDVTIEGVAKRLGVTVRVLRRHLRDAGTSHRQILDDLRCRLATRHLRDGRWTTEEVAFLTGFSATSAFHRAFRRWTGRSVGTVREPGGS